MVPSLKIAFTPNCCEVPRAIDAVAGVSVKDLMTADVTYTDVVFVIPPALAVIVTGLPLLLARPVTFPVMESTEARVGFEDDHVALVIVCVVLSL